MNLRFKIIIATVAATLPALQTFAQDDLKPLPLREYPEPQRGLDALDAPQTYFEKLGISGSPAKTGE